MISTPQLSIYEPRELKQVCQGWHLYKKFKFNYQPVRRYINLVAEDFAKNKILVSANLSNIFNSFQVNRLYNSRTQAMDKQQSCFNNFFDYDKWI